MDTIRGLLVASTVVTLALTAACGGGSSSGVSTPRSARAEFVRDQVADAMRRVVSYRVDADPGGGLRYSVEYERPDSYHTSSIYDLPGAGYNESLFVGNKRYLGSCDADGADCDWVGPSRRRDVLDVGGASSPFVLPQWPIVAFEMATGLVLSTDGGEVHLRGQVNHIRAIAANSARWMGSMSDDELQKLLHVDYYDNHPATIDSVIDTQTHLVKSVTITADRVSTPEPLVGEFHIVFRYSKYNDITIEAPE